MVAHICYIDFGVYLGRSGHLGTIVPSEAARSQPQTMANSLFTLTPEGCLSDRDPRTWPKGGKCRSYGNVYE